MSTYIADPDRFSADLTTLLRDRRVARMELFRDGSSFTARLIVHMDDGQSMTRLAVGAQGSGLDAFGALHNLLRSTEGTGYD